MCFDVLMKRSSHPPKFLSAGAALAQASRLSTTQPQRRFFQRPTAARGSAASRPRPASADRQLLPPLPPRVEGSGRFPVDVGHCSRLRLPPPLTLPSPASITDASHPDHVTLFDAEVEARREEGSIVDVSPSPPGIFAHFFSRAEAGWLASHHRPQTAYTFIDCARFH